MNSDQQTTFLLVYASVAAFFTIWFALLTNKKGRWVRLVVAVLGLIAAAIAVAMATPFQNFIQGIGHRLAQRDLKEIAATTTGLLAGVLAAFALQGFSDSRKQRLATYAAHMGLIAVFSAVVLRELLTPLVGGWLNGSGTDSTVAGFSIEEVAQLDIAPTGLAVGPDGKVYVSGYAGVIFQSGNVVRLDPDSATGKWRATEVANYLNRPHGIAFSGKDLYVSRSGQFTEAKDGRFVHRDTGAVTRLEDRDGDGIFDYYTDVVSDLPGSQMPDGLHQNNGLAIDSKGFLYVTVGAPTDHSPTIHPFAGTIVRSKLDGSEKSIFARGFRNPFGIAIGPNDHVFCTDNDGNTYKNGDTLSHVVEGGHYGFPYTALDPKDVKVKGLNKPLLRSPTAISGLCYVPPGAFPSGYDDCLYVAANGTSHLNRIQLTQKKAGFDASMEPFVAIPGIVVAVAYSPQERVLYACNFDLRKVYRIAPR